MPQVTEFGPMPTGDPAKITLLEYTSRAVIVTYGAERLRYAGYAA
jgi:hypothetical protein